VTLALLPMEGIVRVPEAQDTGHFQGL